MAVPEPLPSQNLTADEEYQRQLALFVRCSDEKRRQEVQLRNLVHQLPRRETFLDVGAGGGDLTVPLSRLFASTWVVEPNTVQARRLKAAYPQWQIQNCGFDEAQLGDQRFDFILCSHVLYYVPEPHWFALVERMVDRLTVGGKVVVVLQSPAGEVATFSRHFNAPTVDMIPLWDALVTRYGETAIDARYSQVLIQTPSLEEMTAIGLFLLIDRQFQQRQAEVSAYLQEHHRTADGYRMRQGQIMISVTRQGE